MSICPEKHYRGLAGMEDLRTVDLGNDSVVLAAHYRGALKLLKSYHPLQQRHPDRDMTELLTQYYGDMERSQQILQADADQLSHDQVLHDVLYQCRYVMAPSGKVESYQSVPYAVIDKWVPGASLGSAHRDNKPLEDSAGQPIIITTDIREEIESNARTVASCLNEEFGTSHRLTAINMKPTIDAEERVITITITDLAASFDESYQHILYEDGYTPPAYHSY